MDYRVDRNPPDLCPAKKIGYTVGHLSDSGDVTSTDILYNPFSFLSLAYELRNIT